MTGVVLKHEMSSSYLSFYTGSSTGSVKTPRADPPVQGQSAVAAPDRVLSGQQPSSDQERKGSGAYEEGEPLCAQSLQKERKQKTSESTFDLGLKLALSVIIIINSRFWSGCR